MKDFDRKYRRRIPGEIQHFITIDLYQCGPEQVVKTILNDLTAWKESHELPFTYIFLIEPDFYGAGTQEFYKASQLREWMEIFMFEECDSLDYDGSIFEQFP